jgi:hypothetical protein
VFKVHKGIMTFRDQNAFDSFIEDTKNRTDNEWDDWEISNNFKSLKTILEEVIEAEDVFLNEMNIKFHGDESITRKEIGYTKLSQKYIDNGLLLVNEYETLDLNLPIEFYSRLVNSAGILRIGNDIHVPKKDFIMIIKDGDFGKIEDAKTYKVGNLIPPDIEIANVINKSNQAIEKINDTGRSSAYAGSCDNVNGSYRLIVYDGWQGIIFYNDGSFPCPNVYVTYSVRFRSLKKILGTWQNHKTSQWSLRSSLIADHFGKCPNKPRYFIQNICNVLNVTYPGPYDHTWDHYFFSNVHVGPCESGGLDSCDPTSTDDPQGQVEMLTRSHNATGKNGTTCYVGLY